MKSSRKPVNPATVFSAAFLSLILAPAATAATVDLELISRRVYAAGDSANGDTRVDDATPDGRYLLLATKATNLAAGIEDENLSFDLVVYDRVAQSYDWITTSASEPGSAQALAAGSSVTGKISADGRWIAYSTASVDAVSGVADDNGEADVFLFDRLTRAVSLVSRRLADGAAAGGSVHGISEDGRYVLFSSAATDLVAGQVDGNAARDLFIHDRTTGAAHLASPRAGQPATAADRGASALDFSRDGRYVLYQSHSSDLVAGFTDNNGSNDVDLFLFDRQTASAALITHVAGSATTGATGSIHFYGPSRVLMTPSGSHVLFAHQSRNLVSGFTGGILNVFVWERATSTHRLVSGANGSASAGAADVSRPNAISADGRFVLFQSWDRNIYPWLIVPGPSAGGLFRFDLATSSAQLINHVDSSQQIVTGGDPVGRFLSDDGRYSVFDGAAFVIAGQGGEAGVFVYDHQNRSARLLSPLPGQPNTAVRGVARSFSADGRYISFESLFDLAGDGSDPVPSQDVFLFDRQAGGSSIRVSNAAEGGSSAGQVATSAIAFFGADLLFHTDFSGLAPLFSDSNNSSDPLIYEATSGAFSPLLRSAANASTAPNGGSTAQPLGTGGAFVFTSSATNLVTGLADGNAASDVFLGHRSSPLYQLVSSVPGQPATAAAGASSGPVAAAGGGKVAFATLATNATPATDANGESDVVLWTAGGSGGGTLISHAAGNPGASADDASQPLAISDDGGVLLFRSDAGDVVTSFVDRNGAFYGDLYLRRAGANHLVTRLAGGTPGDGSTGVFDAARLAPDGSVAVFQSTGFDLVAGATDGNGGHDLFAYDAAAGTASLLSHRPGEPLAAADQPSFLKDLGGKNGRFVLLESAATDLLPGATDPDFSTNVYLLDRVLGRVFLITHPAGDPHGKAGGTAHEVSDDGRYVLFSSRSAGMVAGQLPGTGDGSGMQLLLHDRATGERLLVSHLPGDDLRGGGPGYASAAVLGPAGDTLAFLSSQHGLTPEDPGGFDLFFGRVDRGGQLFSDGFELGDSSLWSATFAGQ